MTGVIHPEDLPADWVDLSHEMGVSEEGYMKLPGALRYLDDIDLILEDDDD